MIWNLPIEDFSVSLVVIDLREVWSVSISLNPFPSAPIYHVQGQMIAHLHMNGLFRCLSSCELFTRYLVSATSRTVRLIQKEMDHFLGLFLGSA